MEERISMSQRERERLKVLHHVERGGCKQKEAAERLELSARQVRRLQRRVEAEGDRGLVHGLRGRPSNRRIEPGVQERILAEVGAHYADFGPTLAREQLARQGVEVSRETLRKWMSAAGLWRARRQKIQAVHVWRPRRAAFGELVMWDTSEHRWLEDRGPQLQLIGMIDDATSRLWARFAEQDSIVENLRLLQEWLERHGRPVAFYTDKGGLFRVNRPLRVEEELRGQERPRTEIGRALGELGIEWIAAHSPQAKGRIERAFGTLQDRLVKQLRLAGAATVEQANRYLRQVFLPDWERRFTVRPRQGHDAHRRLEREHRLESILSVCTTRQVARDYTVSWEGERWGVRREDVRAGLRGAQVRVERRLDGSRWLRFREKFLPLVACPEAPRASASPCGLRPTGLAEPTPQALDPDTGSSPSPTPGSGHF